jgi:hypothetical protein
MAIATHPREHDLIVGTHGRSIFVLDDLSPLRQLAATMTQKPKLAVFPATPAIAHETAQSPGERFPGHGEFRGPSRPRGVFLHVYADAPELKHADKKKQKEREAAQKAAEAQKAKDAPAEAKPTGAKADEKPADAAPKPPEEPKDKATIEVWDAAGAKVRTWREDLHLGLNRVVWRFQRDGGPGPARELQDEPEFAPAGREVLPGEYLVTVRFQGEQRDVKVTVEADPRVEIAAADRAAKDALRQQKQDLETELHRATQRFARSRKDIDVVEKRLAVEPKPKPGATDPHKALRDAIESVTKAATALDEQLWGKKPTQGIARDDDGMIAKALELMRVTGTDDAPNATERALMDRAAAKVPAVAAAVDAFLAGPLAEVRKAVEASGLQLLTPAAAK